MPTRHDTGLEATISDVIDAVVLYDQPILDYRFSEFVGRHPDDAARNDLLSIPAVVTRGARITRAAAFEWERVADPVLVSDVVTQAERVLLQAFLDGAEAQIRLKAFIARQAPTKEVRDLIETAIGLHRDVTGKLRQALPSLSTRPPGEESVPAENATPRFTQEESGSGDLRGQVEHAIRSMRARGKTPSGITVSHVALRHLRDEGTFADEETSILGVPVNVDLSWEASEFSLHSHETIPMEEIVRSTRGT